MLETRGLTPRLLYDAQFSALACEDDLNHISTAILSSLEVRFDLTLNRRPSQSDDCRDFDVQVTEIACEIVDDDDFNRTCDWSPLGTGWGPGSLRKDREDVTLGCVKADKEAWIKFDGALGSRESETASNLTRSDVSRYREFVVGFKENAIQLCRQQSAQHLNTTYDPQGKVSVYCLSRPTFRLYGLNATELWVWLHVFKPYHSSVCNHPPQLPVGEFVHYWITFQESLRPGFQQPVITSYATILAAEGLGTVSMRAPLLQGLTVGSYVLILLGGATLSIYGELEEGRGVYKAVGGPVTAILLLAFTVMLKKLFPLWALTDALSFKLKIDSISSLPPNRATIIRSVLPKKPDHAWLSCLFLLMSQGHILASGPYACWSPNKSVIGGFKLDRRVKLLSLAAAGVGFDYHLSFGKHDGNFRGCFLILKADYRDEASRNYRELGRATPSCGHEIHLVKSSDPGEERLSISEYIAYAMVRRTSQINVLQEFITTLLSARLSLLREAVVGGASEDQWYPVSRSQGKLLGTDQKPSLVPSSQECVLACTGPTRTTIGQGSGSVSSK